MNFIHSSTSPHLEAVRRINYLLPVPFLLVAFVCPLLSLTEHNLIFVFCGTLSLSLACYVRHLGAKWLRALRWDDAFDGYPSGTARSFESMTAADLDRLIEEIEKSNAAMAEQSPRAKLLREMTYSRRKRPADPDAWLN